MFERFTQSAKDVVRAAVERGEKAGAATPAHLLAALLDREHTDGAAALAHFGVDRERAADAVRARQRRGGLNEREAAALAELGIDLDAVVDAVEREHGAGAMASRGARRRFGARFTTEAKRVLERSLREALDLRDKHIGDEHLLLALLALGDADDLGLDYTEVRSWLTGTRRGTGTR